MTKNNDKGDAVQFDTVKAFFTQYLVNKGYRKTPERFTILKEIYSEEGHFDIESLYIRMKTKRYEVSRATLYNTIEILLESGLVVKHQFGNNCAQFERSFKFKQHDHAVCMRCGAIHEFCDPRLHEIQATAAEDFNFDVQYHSLIFYGFCEQCKEKN